MPQAYALIDELKQALRERGLTYRDVAAELDLSEASVKRMFSQRHMSLGRMEKMLALVRLEFTDLANRLAEKRELVSELTPEQEEALVADPALLLVTFLVVNRWRIDDMVRAYSLTEKEIESRLIRLDRLNIIELLPFNRYRLLTARNFTWRRDGPVQRAFATHIRSEFFESSFAGTGERLRFLTGGLTPASITRFNDKLDQLVQQFDELVERDAALPIAERKTCSAVLAMRPIEYSMFADYRSPGHPRKAGATDST